MEICLPPYKSKNSTSGTTRRFDLYFGQDAEPVQVDGLGSSWIPLPTELLAISNATEDNSSYRMSVALDEDITLHSLSIPEYPVASKA